jgi:hypothetical protein
MGFKLAVASDIEIFDNPRRIFVCRFPPFVFSLKISMNINHQRAVDRYIGVPICWLLSGLNRVFKREPDGIPPQKILVILLSEMGSLVLAQPMFMRLKQQYPEASIHVLMFGKNREVLDLMELIPRENVITLNDGSLLL